MDELDTMVYNGRRYTILAKCNSDDEANQFMANHPNTGVLCVGPLGVVYIASKSDKGIAEPLRKAQK